MLLAVEGGGFFSSSATGYSKGLSLLFLDQKKEDKSKPMRVLPRNQYQLVNEECEPDLQLASPKHHFASGCLSFVCFGRASTGIDSSQLKVCPTQQQGIRTVPPVSINGKRESTIIRKENDSRKSDLKSSLRKRSKSIPRCEDNLQCEELFHKYPDDTCSNGRRSIQWMDDCGGELVEIREFIPSFFHFTHPANDIYHNCSEVGGSDDELNYGNVRTCLCRIM